LAVLPGIPVGEGKDLKDSKDGKESQDGRREFAKGVAAGVVLDILAVLRVLEGGQGMSEGFIPPHGGYKQLLSYQKSEIVFDATVFFCDCFVDKRSRTHDQMIQAARSGKQNIIEGSMAAATPKRCHPKILEPCRSDGLPAEASPLAVDASVGGGR